jgi:CBS domain-containing protein
MKGSPQIISLLPDLFKISRPITAGSSPLIVSGNLLHLDEVQVLPIVQGLQPRIDKDKKIKVYAALAGYSVLDKIHKAKPEDYLKLLWTPCQEMPVWIGSVKDTDSYDDLLKVFDVTKFGDAAAEGNGSFPALVSLKEILELFRNNKIKSSAICREYGSNIISTSEDTRIIDALDLMFQKRIRRVFLAQKESSSFKRFISSRDVIRFLFSPERLEIAKKTPPLWLDALLSDIKPSEAKTVADDEKINEASRYMGDRADDCLVLENSKKVISRWDIVMKSWKSGNYSFGV